MKPSELLEKAAEVAGTLSHAKKIGIEVDGGTGKPTGCCTYGALEVVDRGGIETRVSFGQYVMSPACDDAVDFLKEELRQREGHRRVASWNDRPETTKAGVVELLRASASRAAAAGR